MGSRIALYRKEQNYEFIKFIGVLALIFVFLIAYAGTTEGSLEDDLREAAKEGSTDKVKALLAQGADVNAKDKDGFTALIRAAGNGHTETVKALLAADANVNVKTKGITALKIAKLYGHEEIVLMLKKAGAK